jgi:hypothetical protein
LETNNGAGCRWRLDTDRPEKARRKRVGRKREIAKHAQWKGEWNKEAVKKIKSCMGYLKRNFSRVDCGSLCKGGYPLEVVE